MQQGHIYKASFDGDLKKCFTVRFWHGVNFTEEDAVYLVNLLLRIANKDIRDQKNGHIEYIGISDTELVDFDSQQILEREGSNSLKNIAGQQRHPDRVKRWLQEEADILEL